jgi:hypothetical protein
MSLLTWMAPPDVLIERAKFEVHLCTETTRESF